MDRQVCVAEAKISGLHYINGVRVDSSEAFEVFSPIDGQILGEVALGTHADVGAAVAAAADAFASWAALGAHGRPNLRTQEYCSPVCGTAWCRGRLSTSAGLRKQR